MADRINVPVVHTLHGPFTAETTDFYRRHSAKAHAVAISQAQRRAAPPELRIAGVIPNPLDVTRWPYRTDKEDYLLWVGRMHETKGPHRAIAAARRAGSRRLLAGPVQPGQEQFFETSVAPHIDGSRVGYLGEIGGAKKRQVFAAARGLLMPIRWEEPFGMVMVEALACGTPVIAFPEGAAPEIVRHNRTGYLVEDEVGMAAAVPAIGRLSPASCRADVLDRFDVSAVSAAYEEVYRRVLRGGKSAGRSRRSTPRPRIVGVGPTGLARQGSREQ